MFIGRVEICRVGYINSTYGRPDPSKPFLAKIEVFGDRNKSELTLSPELSQRIVEIVAAEIADAGRAMAEAMTVEALSVTPLPAPDNMADAEVPF